ncbi:MAG: hypothetical protein KH415_02150 [Clostridium sp.]|nr:hypothetical protein [Clostridium sp.]
MLKVQILTISHELIIFTPLIISSDIVDFGGIATNKQKLEMSKVFKSSNRKNKSLAIMLRKSLLKIFEFRNSLI